jgi:S1-C subfamily serine protease
VSAKGRNIHILPDQQFPIESFIQTDAAVNPGNSGGALVSTNGDLIGINTAIASNTGAYTGYSFAIPVNMVKKVVDDLLEYGNVQRGFIGVNIRDIDSKLADEKGIKSLKGVYVAGITEGGAASNAGIKEGDIITHVSGNIVNSSPELQEQVSRFRPVTR